MTLPKRKKRATIWGRGSEGETIVGKILYKHSLLFMEKEKESQSGCRFQKL